MSFFVLLILTAHLDQRPVVREPRGTALRTMASEGKTVEDLQNQVQKLTGIVDKQSRVISSTGQQLMELQVRDIKQRMNKKKDGATPDNKLDVHEDVDGENFATNEDLVVLVKELQEQLDLLEERSIKRTFNSHLSEKHKEAKVAPLRNKDGDEPSEDIFCKNVGDFLELDKSRILQLCEFYELVVSREQEESIEKLKDDQNLSLEEAKKIMLGVPTGNLKDRIDSYTDKEFEDCYDNLARYLGLRIRRAQGSW